MYIITVTNYLEEETIYEVREWGDVRYGGIIQQCGSETYRSYNYELDYEICNLQKYDRYVILYLMKQINELRTQASYCPFFTGPLL